MPSHGRRRFSVQRHMGGGGAPKVQNGSPTPVNLQIKTESEIAATSSDTTPSVVEVRDGDSTSSDVSLQSSIVVADQSHLTLTDTKDHVMEQTIQNIDIGKGRQRSVRHRKHSEYQKKLSRNHYVIFRGPKYSCIGPKLTCTDDIRPVAEVSITTRTIGSNPIDWQQEIENYCTMLSTALNLNNMERVSNHSMGDMCRICHGDESTSVELGRMISACACRGTVGRVHVRCLERWLTESGKSRCELCGTRYLTQRVHRYGVPRALLMWVLSHNVKQLMVDSLGIMLMSPLAVLAAWLSGRTLAALMAQDSHLTPWPLASTFVLACMTLVCYYCWIVSAATRHALGWWIWYRSQYEIRLQCDQVEE